jgi:hypothetical protein
LGWEGSLVLIALGLLTGLVVGRGVGIALGCVAVFALFAAWIEGLAVIQDWLRAHHEWTYWRRLSLFFGLMLLLVPPLAAFLWKASGREPTSNSSGR